MSKILNYAVMILFLIVGLIGSRMLSKSPSGTPPATSGMAFILIAIAGLLASNRLCQCSM